MHFAAHHEDVLMDVNNYADRRTAPRLPIEASVQFQPIEQLEAIGETLYLGSQCGLSRDISATGMRLCAPADYPIDGRLLLTFEYLEQGCVNITSREGTVVWSRPVNASCERMLGIRFADLH